MMNTMQGIMVILKATKFMIISRKRAARIECLLGEAMEMKRTEEYNGGWNDALTVVWGGRRRRLKRPDEEAQAVEL